MTPIPEHRPEPRRRAAAAIAAGEPDAALTILSRELALLKPFFDEPDEDDDAGWHIAEAKSWQLWALGKLAARALAAMDPLEREGAATRIREVAPDGLHAASILVEEHIMDRIEELRWQIASGDDDAIVAAALGAFAEAARFDEQDSDLAISSERDAVMEELLAPIGQALVVVAERGRQRAEVRRLAAARGHRVHARVLDLLGTRADESEDEARRLLEAREQQSGDARFETDLRLVHHLRAQLSDDALLAICDEHGWRQPAIVRLLARGRVDEAQRLAADVSDHGRLEVVAVFRDHGYLDVAIGLLEPCADHDALHAELYAALLLQAGAPEALEAHVVWFQKRPTRKTRDAIADALGGRFVSVRERLLDHVQQRGLPPLDGKPRAAGPPKAPRSSPPVIDRVAPIPERVVHKKFGEGRVLRAEGSGEAMKFVIAFAEHGQKTLLARFVQPYEEA